MVIQMYRGNSEVLRFSITDADGNGPDLSDAEFALSVRQSPGASPLFTTGPGSSTLVEPEGGEGVPSVVDVKIAPSDTEELSASPTGTRYLWEFTVTVGDDVYTFPRNSAGSPIPGHLLLHTP